MFVILDNEDKDDLKNDSDHYIELIQNVKIELKETDVATSKCFRPSS